MAQAYCPSVTSVDHDNLEAKLRMANVLEDMGRKTEALEIVSEGASESIPHSRLSPYLCLLLL